MGSTTPLTGARYPAGADAPALATYYQNLGMDLDGFTIPRFANATARDAAYSASATAGKPLTEGMHCYMLDDHRLWRYDGSVWTWPKAAQGQLARADFTTASGSQPLAATAGILSAFNMTIATLPANRHVRVMFTCNIIADAVNTQYGFLLAVGSFQYRQVHNVATTTTEQGVTMQALFDTTTLQSGVVCSVTGGRFGGTGNTSLNSTVPDGPAQFLVEDVGAV